MLSNESERDPGSESDRPGLWAVVERYRDEPDQCTIFPADANDEERLTTWITAKSPYYVDTWQHR